MTSREFNLWMRSAYKGCKLIYHTGSLARARGEGKALAGTDRAKVQELGDYAHIAYKTGEVTLVQRRVAPDCFDYIAIKL
jgi:hypothetical protein